MRKIYEYSDGILRAGEGSQIYFELDLNGRVKLHKPWDTFELSMAWVDAAEFLRDFYARRKVVKVDDYEVKRFSITPGVEYRLSVMCDDCSIYFNHYRGDYGAVLVEHDNFIMLFSQKKFLLKLLGDDRRCEVVGSGLDWGEMEDFVRKFSDDEINLNAKCSFKLVGDELEVYSGEYLLFSVGFDGVERGFKGYAYHYGFDVDDDGDLFMFLWELFERYKDRLKRVEKRESVVFEGNSFEFELNFAGGLKFEYYYKGSDFSFRISLSSGFNNVEIMGRDSRGVVFRCKFKGSVGFFRELVKNVGGFSKYIPERPRYYDDED